MTRWFRLGHGQEPIGEALQTDLKCGTHCGSCAAELTRMVRALVPLAQTAWRITKYPKVMSLQRQ